MRITAILIILFSTICGNVYSQISFDITLEGGLSNIKAIRNPIIPSNMDKEELARSMGLTMTSDAVSFSAGAFSSYKINNMLSSKIGVLLNHSEGKCIFYRYDYGGTIYRFHYTKICLPLIVIFHYKKISAGLGYQISYSITNSGIEGGFSGRYRNSPFISQIYELNPFDHGLILSAEYNLGNFSVGAKYYSGQNNLSELSEWIWYQNQLLIGIQYTLK